MKNKAFIPIILILGLFTSTYNYGQEFKSVSFAIEGHRSEKFETVDSMSGGSATYIKEKILNAFFTTGTQYVFGLGRYQKFRDYRPYYEGNYLYFENNYTIGLGRPAHFPLPLRLGGGAFILTGIGKRLQNAMNPISYGGMKVHLQSGLSANIEMGLAALFLVDINFGFQGKISYSSMDNDTKQWQSLYLSMDIPLVY